MPVATTLKLSPKRSPRSTKSQHVFAGGVKFVDLFAGIGGFHQALADLGGECVFASEIDPEAARVYKDNFGVDPLGDITKITDPSSLPDFNFLCAGFPCQPFSKGGLRRGFEDTRGTLFFDICRILEVKKPTYILLENVPNLVSHDEGKTYETIIRTLNDLGYITPSDPLILSPEEFGIPVHRPRIYIPGVLKTHVVRGHLDLSFNEQDLTEDIYTLLNPEESSQGLAISGYEKKILALWNEFYQGIDLKIIGFPVWADEFSKKYSYRHLPEWKQNFVAKNRELYARNKKFIQGWLKKHKNLSWVSPSHRKFEWQAGSKYKNVYECLIQFRPSGVRVRKPDKFSALVAMNHPQIVGKYLRRLSSEETKRLQSFPKKFRLHPDTTISRKQLGNAVNVEVVKAVVTQLLKSSETL